MQSCFLHWSPTASGRRDLQFFSLTCSGWSLLSLTELLNGRMGDVVSHDGLPVYHPPHPQSPGGNPRTEQDFLISTSSLRDAAPSAGCTMEKPVSFSVVVLWPSPGCCCCRWTSRYWKNLCSRTTWMHVCLLFCFVFFLLVCVCV